MKKLPLICICLCCSLTAGGCNSSDALEKYISKEKNQETTSSPKERIYMDEFSGSLENFDGNYITLKSGDHSYVFDVSQATLECQNGLICGDSVSVIYEGQLSSSDTSTVKALKVTDDFHKKKEPEEKSLHGQVQEITPNTITIQEKNKKSFTYPLTCAEQYYKNGLKKGNWVYLHYKGNKDKNPQQLKVLSVSDIEPLKPPAKKPVAPVNKEDPPSSEKTFRASIQNIHMNTLDILPEGSDTPLHLDLSSIPCYFKAGIAPGAFLKVSYTGDFQTNTLDGISISSVTGESPKKNKHYITSTITGTIIGSTSNTLTMQTNDGAFVTCERSDAVNNSTGGLLSGSSIKVTFDPSASENSNIYKCLKIEDA